MLKLFLLLNPTYATLFWAIVLNTGKAQGNEPKSFLGMFFVVACLTFFSYVLYFLPLPEIYIYEDTIYLLTHLLIFPMYYIYVRLLAIDRQFSWRKHYIHFLVPAVLIVFYAAGDLYMTKAERFDFIYKILIDGETATGIFLYRKIVYDLTRAVFIIQGIVYMTGSILVVLKNRKSVVNFYSNIEDDSLDKVHWLNLTVAVTMTSCIVMEFIGKEKFTGNDYLLIGPSIVYTVMLFFIGWLGNRQKAVLLMDTEEEYENASGEDTISKNARIKNRLKKLLNEEQIYLNKDLTIWELAKKVNTNRSYLSQIINNEYGQNFSVFVNSYRMRHAENLKQSQPDLSKSNIAELSGFGSAKSWKRAKNG